MKLSLLVVLTIVLVAPVRGEYATTINYQQEDGTVISMDSFAGQYLLVDAMATWCGTCKDEMPHLQQIRSATNGSMVMLSLSLDAITDDIIQVKNFMQANNGTWLYGLDIYGQFMHDHPVDTYPTLFFFDPSGKEIAKWVGPTDSATMLNVIKDYVPVNGTGTHADLGMLMASLGGSSFFTAFVLIFAVITIVLIGSKIVGWRNKTT